MSHDYLIQLILLITQPAEISSIQEETFKHPFIASQFFCTQFSKLTEKILENQELFELLLNFLNQTELLPVLAGYFSKACDNLLETNTERFLFEIFKINGHIKLTQNLKNSALADLLGKILLKASKFYEFSKEIHESLNEIGERLLEEDEIFCYNAVNMLRRIGDYKNIEISGFLIKIMNRNSKNEPSVIIYKCYIKENPSFVDNLIKGIQSQQKFLKSTCLKILHDLFSIIDIENAEEVTWLLSIFSVALKSFLDILKEKTMSQEFLSVLEIIKCLIKIGNQEICEKLIDLGIFRVILESLDLFPFCTFFHNLFSSVFSAIFHSNLLNIKKHALRDLEIIDYIIFHTENPMITSKKYEIRKGFIPHLFFIANLLQELKKSDTYLVGLLKQHKDWKKFVRSTLQIQNFIERKSLGGESLENFFDKSSSSDEIGGKVNNFFEKSDNEFSDFKFWKLPLTVPGTLEVL